MVLTDEQRLRMALIHLKHLEQERGILINGNITAIANRSKVSVRELRKAYDASKTA